MTNDYKVLGWIAIVAGIIMTAIVSFTLGYVLGYSNGSLDTLQKPSVAKSYYAWRV